MDEIVNLASFEFDTTRLNKSLDELNNKMFEFGEQQKANKAIAAQYRKEIAELNKIQGLLENTNAESSDAYKENEARIQALNTALRANNQVQAQTATQISRVRTEITQTNRQLAAYTTAEGELTSLIDKGNKALETQINNKNEAVASNRALREITAQLNPAIEEEAALLQQLNARIDENTNFIRANSSAQEQQMMNIGNYTDSIREAAASINPLNGGLGGFIERANAAGGVAPLLTGAFAAMRVGIIGATQAGLAFLATPIGAFLAALAVAVGVVVGAFKFMTASMNSTEEGSNRLAKITGAITGLFNGFFKVIKPFGEFLGTVFITAIEAVGEALDSMATGLANAAEFIGLDGLAEDIRGVQTEVKASAIAAMELATAEGQLERMQRNAIKTQKQYEKQSEILRQQRDDETNSIGERMALNDKLAENLKNQANAELAIAKQRLAVSQALIKSEGETTDALNKRAEAEGIIADIEERITGIQSEQLAALNSLRKEAAAQEAERQQKAAEARQKALDDAVTKQKEDLDFYIASQGEKKRALDEQLKYEQVISDKRLQVLEKEYAAGKISKTAYETEKLNIANDLLQKQTDATIVNADLELRELMLNNQRKIDANQFFSETIYQQEIERINRINEAEAAALKLRLDNGLVSQKEYDLALRELNLKTQAENDAIFNEREAAKKEAAAADLAIQKELDDVNFQYDLDAQMARFEQERALEREAAEKSGADMVAFDELTAKRRKEIDRSVMDNKLSLASQTFNNLAAIVGAESAAGKAFAVAQATIDTYQAANRALASIPPPFSYVAAAAAVVAGISNVKKITQVKEPKVERPRYARGVIGLSGAGSGDSDSIPANLSLGESVINANSTAMFAPLLSAINQLGGGVGMDASSSILSQSGITQSADNSQMTNMIANAVYEGSLMGTAKGSQQGIVGLSENRQIQANALN